MSVSIRAGGTRGTWDLASGGLALLCAVHCLLPPLVMAWIPGRFDGLSVWVLAATALFWLVAIRIGHARHGRLDVVALGLAGLGGMGAATLIETGALRAPAWLPVHLVKWASLALFVSSLVWNRCCAPGVACSGRGWAGRPVALALGIVIALGAAASLLPANDPAADVPSWTRAVLDGAASKPGDSYEAVLARVRSRVANAGHAGRVVRGAQRLLHRLVEVEGLLALFQREHAAALAGLADCQARREAGMCPPMTPLRWRAHVADVRLQVLVLSAERDHLAARVNELAGRLPGAPIELAPLRAEMELRHVEDVVRPALGRLLDATTAALRLGDATMNDVLEVRERVLAAERLSLGATRRRLDALAGLLRGESAAPIGSDHLCH